jgi:AraC-like DNA-binding protein
MFRGESDPLADVIAAMGVRSVLYGRLEASASWGVDFRATPHAKFAMVVRGSCWLTVQGEHPIALRGGDCFVVAGGTSFALRDTPRARLVSCDRLTQATTDGVLRCGGGGAQTVVISGWFEFHTWSRRPLVELLPRLIYIRADEPKTHSLRITLELLASETQERAPGTSVVVNRLADVLFVQAIRAHLASNECAGTKWLNALKHKQIGVALGSIHRDIARPWTVEALAVTACMSRSAFAFRFKELLDESPVEYLTRWRMCKASCYLRDGNRSIAEVATAVGYESAGAFQRTFKRVFTVTPREFMRRPSSGTP